MKYIAQAKVSKKIVINLQLRKKITANVRILTGGGGECPLYDLIDGGKPDTVYEPINGFNLIDGN
jgi:hypothetical protein